MESRLGTITTNKVHSQTSLQGAKRRGNPVLKLLTLLLCLIVLGSCSGFKTRTDANTLRLGYLLNISHAVPILGVENQGFSNVEAQYFTSGGYLLNALITQNIDIAYIGPGPYINALSKGVKLKLLKLSSSGANSLILSKEYQNGKTFKIKRLAVPQLGNTQDLLAKYLVDKTQEHKERYKTLTPEMQQLVELPNIKFSKKLEYIAVNPAELETVFFGKNVDAALTAEPWGTVLEEKGYINLNQLAVNEPYNLVDELEGSTNGIIYQQLSHINQFPAALLVVDEDFYKLNTKLVDNFVKEQDEILEFILLNEDLAITTIQKHLKKTTKKTIDHDFLTASFKKLSFSDKLDQSKLDELREVAQAHKYIRKKGN